jgi:hypothetical protein
MWTSKHGLPPRKLAMKWAAYPSFNVFKNRTLEFAPISNSKKLPPLTPSDQFADVDNQREKFVWNLLVTYDDMFSNISNRLLGNGGNTE